MSVKTDLEGAIDAINDACSDLDHASNYYDEHGDEPSKGCLSATKVEVLMDFIETLREVSQHIQEELEE
jgi:hypothetical protein